MADMKECYCIKDGYQVNREPSYYLDVSAQFVYQPDVYELAFFLGQRTGAKYVIDIGSGNGVKLQKFLPFFQVVCLDFGDNRTILEQNLPGVQFIETNLENGLPDLSADMLREAIVIAADVVEHIPDPELFLQGLARVSQEALYVLISTPDRVRCRGVGDDGPPANPCHVREWALDEFSSVLQRYQVWPSLMGYTVNTDFHLQKSTLLAVAGREMYRPPAREVSVLAVINAYNEADMIEETIYYLLTQGIDVRLVDNWSNDGTYEKGLAMAKQWPQQVTVERFPEEPTGKYEWEKLLRHTVDCGTASGYDWVMHQDADEIRETPWQQANLRQAISHADALGYNAIDFTVLDFRPVEPDAVKREGDCRMRLPFFEFGKRPGHFLQIKAWKNQAQLDVELGASGGHEAAFAGRKTFPLKFISRHYPIRSQEHGRKKIFQERKARFLPAEKEGKGWHIQYDHIQPDDKLLWDRSQLITWNRHVFDCEYLVERLSGIGIRR